MRISDWSSDVCSSDLGCAACSDACGAAASTSAVARESGLTTDADMVFSLRVAEPACCGAGVLRSRKLEKALAGTKSAVVANPAGRWCSDCPGRGSASAALLLGNERSCTVSSRWLAYHYQK